MSSISEKTLLNRASSKKYYEKNKEKEQEKAQLRMATLRCNNANTINPVANRISSKKFYEQNKDKEREKARRHMALLRVRQLAEANAANNSPDLSYLNGEGDEHLKDISALELWRQTFKRKMKIAQVKFRYDKIVQDDATKYANQEEENMEKSDLFEALEVEALLAED